MKNQAFHGRRRRLSLVEGDLGGIRPPAVAADSYGSSRRGRRSSCRSKSGSSVTENIVELSFRGGIGVVRTRS